MSNCAFLEVAGYIDSSREANLSCAVAWPTFLRDVRGTVTFADTIRTDPQFCDSTSWRLLATSPCRAENNPKACDRIGAVGVCDETPVRERSWGWHKLDWLNRRGGN